MCLILLLHQDLTLPWLLFLVNADNFMFASESLLNLLCSVVHVLLFLFMFVGSLKSGSSYRRYYYSNELYSLLKYRGGEREMVLSAFD